jgi:hypothetical protein
VDAKEAEKSDQEYLVELYIHFLQPHAEVREIQQRLRSVRPTLRSGGKHVESGPDIAWTERRRGGGSLRPSRAWRA